uniref:Uncharacterized protein n=1 Tax=Caenorhabditis japonica TaxID=281687 RepID=A0A8R1IN97_CAEJA
MSSSSEFRRRHQQWLDDFDSHDDDDADLRSSTWNFIENSSAARQRVRDVYSTSTPRPSQLRGRGLSNGLETVTNFSSLPNTYVA